ncbi:aldehyde dehydrogenase family protein [Salisediminibacterium beveridgei]|uniref:Aldehyde dehydrogenase n=1 Tax=Salisediminibacterium beveridgei TaxID=632773 RepID=A0A1D7QV35_9BACI|nr:aldehyde dehydrogenase family protein [Salisediminibacterium beveridgei]AOM82880.1 Aldehyde dehydrogenase [Salisediminibacterium beveridgei]
MKSYPLFINGKWQDAEQYDFVYNPHDQGAIARVPLANKEEMHLAISAAVHAQKKFSSMPANKRSDILMNAAILLQEQRETAARLVSIEAGKPIKDARKEIARTVMTYTLSAEEARRLPGEFINMDAVPGGEGKTGYVKRQAIGTVGAITPFNFPFNLVAHKIGPALAAGNSVVLKPAEQTPLSAYYIADIFYKAGLPDGVLNVVSGPGSSLGKQLAEDPRVQAISFTGSTDTGKRLESSAIGKKLQMELGSNAAVIVGDDADIERIASSLVRGAFGFQGQVCISVQRIYAHRKIYKSLLSEMRRKTEEIGIGSPLDEANDLSSLITPEAADRVLSWVEEAVDHGAKAITDIKREGAIIHPVILTNTTPEMKVNAEEVFGPVVTVEPFDEWEEAVIGVNHSRYGLQAGIFTNNLHEAFEAADQIETGGVHINDVPTLRLDHFPYGGMKDSGSGREGVKYAVEFLTKQKLISFQSPFY